MSTDTQNNIVDQQKPNAVKDSPTRSLVKALSWRLIASATTFLITFVIFQQVTDKAMSEVAEGAGVITIFDFSLKLLFYYLHERMWTNITWGKYWSRNYWKMRAWRKLYRKMHEEEGQSG